MAKVKSVGNKIKVDLPKEEAKKERSFDQIQQEFGALCARAGHLQYQIFTFEKDLDLINTQVRDLNLEAAALKAKSDAEAVAKQKAETQKTEGAAQ